MIPAPDPTSRDFFEGMYAASDDPWNFASSAYEQGRYAAILAALGDRHYRSAFEPGCSVGVLTEGLAAHADAVLAQDLSANAVERARIRCAHLPHVRIEQGSVADPVSGPFDLIVLSEIGYYFSATDLRAWAEPLLGQLSPGGTLLAAHWLGHSTDHMLTGDHVHDVLRGITAKNDFALQLVQRTDGFRLDRWQRA